MLVNGDGKLWLLAADGSVPPREVPVEGLPDVNNDHVVVRVGERLAHLGGSLAGGTARRVTADDGGMHFLHGVSPDGGQGTINVPSWAPDGSAFAFVDYPFDQRNGLVVGWRRGYRSGDSSFCWPECVDRASRGWPSAPPCSTD